MNVDIPSLEFERKIKEREVKRYFRHSYTGLVQVLKKYIDFDEDRLNSTLFEYAYTTLDKCKLDKTKHSLDLVMRFKMSEIIDKAFNAYVLRHQREFLDCVDSEINQLVEYEYKFGINESFPWRLKLEEKVYSDSYNE